MSDTVTFRMDTETDRILRDLMDHNRATKTQVIKEALRTQWTLVVRNTRPSAWEVYSKLEIPDARGRKHDRARNAKKLIREMLLAKRRNGTL